MIDAFSSICCFLSCKVQNSKDGDHPKYEAVGTWLVIVVCGTWNHVSFSWNHVLRGSSSPMVMEMYRVHSSFVYSNIVSLFSSFSMFKKKKKKLAVLAIIIAVLLLVWCIYLECYKLPLLGVERPYHYLNEVMLIILLSVRNYMLSLSVKFLSVW